MSEDLPRFVYHPDPFGTGSMEISNAVCSVCRRNRGIIYDGPIYGVEDVEAVCPWCIADGNAHRTFGAEFTDIGSVGDYGVWAPVPEHIAQEVAYRTPGFSGWQQARWFTHCNDAGVFLGVVGREELQAIGPAAIAAIREDVSQMPEPNWQAYFQSMSRAGQPTAYLFQCRHCGKYGGYSDHT